MSALNTQILQDTQLLLRWYQEKPKFKKYLKDLSEKDPFALNRLLFRKRPIKLYIEIISQTDPKYKDYYRTTIKQPQKAIELFDSFTSDEFNFNRLRQTLNQALSNINQTTYSQEDIDAINHADSLILERDKQKKFNDYLEKKDYQISLASAKQNEPEKQVEETAEEQKQEESPKTIEPKLVVVQKSRPKYSSAQVLAKAETLFNKPVKPIPQSVLTDQYGQPIKSTPQPQTVVSKPTISQQSTSTISNLASKARGFKAPGILQDLGLSVKLGIKKLLSRYGLNILSGGVGATMGYIVTGGSPLGALVGGGIGSNPMGITTNLITKVDDAANNMLHNQGSKLAGNLGKKAAGNAAKKTVAKAVLLNPWVLGVIGILFLLFILIPGIGLGLLNTNSLLPPYDIVSGAPPETPIGGGSCPDTSGNKGPSCHYLNPAINIFDTSISQTALEQYIKKYSSVFVSAGKGSVEDFKTRVDYIVEKSKQGKLNPALFLGYWKTEASFSTIADPATGKIRDMGCVGDDFYEQVKCSLGIEEFSDPGKNPIANCARSNDANSTACLALKSIRSEYDKTHPINYPIKTFDDFAEAYGPYDHLTDGQPNNCTHTYNELIETAKELGACKTTTPTTPPPPADGNYKKWAKDNFDITLADGFKEDTYRWAYEILSTALGKTTQFKQLLGGGITISPVCGRISQTNGRHITFSYCQGGSTGPTVNESFFKVTLIHELSHIINGQRPGKYASEMREILFTSKDKEDFLTSYSQNSADSMDILCGQTTPDTQVDEDFAESVAYYINSSVRELNYGGTCGIKWGQNPYQTGNYPQHLNFIKGLLGGT